MVESRSGREHSDLFGSEPLKPKESRYTEAEEKIYQEAEHFFRVTHSLIVILLTAISGGIIGFFVAGALDLALVGIVCLIAGLAFGWAIWKS